MTSFALIHSPLVGVSTWKWVADELDQSGHYPILPSLIDEDETDMPYWPQQAMRAAQMINDVAAEPVILVGHSGAGPILPAIGDRLHHPPKAYIFVDAGLPMNHHSRLEMMRAESASWVDDLEQHLRENGRFPEWQDEDLASLVPDKKSRHQLLAELQPRPLSFFTEKITHSDEWESIPCGYIQFSDSYSVHAERAKNLGWPCVKLEAGHFHMLVDATAVANAIIQINKELRCES